MTLPNDVYSPDQLSELTMELREYIGALRDTTLRNQASKTAKKTSLPTMSALLKLVFENVSDGVTPEAMLRELEAMLKNAPTVHLMLAAQPSKEMRRQLVLWFRVEIHPTTLLTFSERHDLGGGIVVRAGSHVYDFSFKRKVVDNQKRITEIAAGV